MNSELHVALTQKLSITEIDFKYLFIQQQINKKNIRHMLLTAVKRLINYYSIHVIPNLPI